MSLPITHPYKNTPPYGAINTVRLYIDPKPWTPSVISTEAWYDAADSNTITVETGVSQWDDKSGNERHVSQESAGSQPTYTTGDYVSFNGNSQMLTNALPFMFDNGEIDVYVVANGLYTTYSRLLAEGNTTITNPFYAIVQVGSSGELQQQIRNDGGADYLHTGICAAIAGVFDDTKKMFFVRDIGNKMFANVNGTTTLTEGAIYTRTATTLDVFSVGGMIYGGSPRYIDADVNEIVITSNLIDADRWKMEGYLAWKWGLVAELPIGHPYKNSRPTN